MVLTFFVGGVGVVETEHGVLILREDDEHAVEGHVDGASRSAVPRTVVILLFSLSFYIHLGKTNNLVIKLALYHFIINSSMVDHDYRGHESTANM